MFFMDATSRVVTGIFTGNWEDDKPKGICKQITRKGTSQEETFVGTWDGKLKVEVFLHKSQDGSLIIEDYSTQRGTVVRNREN